MTLSLTPASTEEYGDALSLLFGHSTGHEAWERLIEGMLLLSNPSPDAPSALFVARQGQSLLGAVLVQALAGGTGVIWPPRAPERPHLEDDLLQAALRWLREQHVELVQAILGPKDALLADPLRRGGFSQPTHLVFLERFAQPHALDGICLRYEPSRSDELQLALSACLSVSQDFPELNPRRSIAEVLRGFQAAGSPPEHWWLRYEGGQLVGMLMLAPETETWEVTYLGVVPWARRRGHARMLLHRALHETYHAGARRLNVCVDGRNTPARQLYHSCGFHERERHDVYLYFWPT